MMKSFSIVLACLFVQIMGFGQVLIHSHNDYEKEKPLTEAIELKAFIIEADVYVDKGQLMVAHHRNEIKPGRTLQALYLDPIIRMFDEHDLRVSSDSSYSFNLMIDCKDPFEEVLPLLLPILKQHTRVFDRAVNRNAIRIVFSGNRGAIEKWEQVPDFIWFDGRPNELYNPAQLARVAYISDSYFNYVKRYKPMDVEPLVPVVEKAHKNGKYVRFWGGPDNPQAWQKLTSVGVDIINTDRVAECRLIYAYSPPLGNRR